MYFGVDMLIVYYVMKIITTEYLAFLVGDGVKQLELLYD
jgi:hypothetical protein